MIDQTFIHRIAFTLDNFKDIGNRTYNFRCPVCGDSKRSESKARGYLYPYKNRYNYKCFNCEIGLSFYKFLEYYFPVIAKEYIFEQFSKTKVEETLPETPTFFHSIEILSDFKQTSKLLSDHKAVKYLESRGIPSKFWSSLFYCNDMNSLVDKLEYHDHLKKYDMNFNDYIVIPFIEDVSVSYLMARSLGQSSSFRYLMLKTSSNGNKIWGLDKVDWNEPIYLVEGVFDAMFLPNSLAVGGISLLQEYKYIQQKAKSKIILVYDNDFKTNKQVFRQISMAISLNIPVVLYDLNFPFKDINQAIQSGWSNDQLISYIQSRTFQGLSAQLEMTQLQIPKNIRELYSQRKQ